jgi:hypothetical protein
MFEAITKKSHEYLDKQIQTLEDTCNQYSDIKEFVSYIVEYSDRMAYSNNDSPTTRIGRELIQFIWQITNIDLSSMANKYHFSPSWASELNSFIANYFLDDSAFDFTQEYGGVFKFKYAGDDGRWLQNPLILIEAAKANRLYYDALDPKNLKFDREVFLNSKVDGSKVYELLENRNV